MKHLLVTASLALLAACSTTTAEIPSDLPALSEAAQSRRFATFQYALEHAPGDRPAQWQISAQLRGSITPLDSLASLNDGWCRSYEEVIADGRKRYRVVGIACRKAGPRWLVLDVRPFTENG